MSTFLPLEINTLFFFYFMKEMKTKLKDMDDEELDEDEIQSTGQRSDDDASKSGGKKN